MIKNNRFVTSNHLGTPIERLYTNKIPSQMFATKSKKNDRNHPKIMMSPFKS